MLLQKYKNFYNNILFYRYFDTFKKNVAYPFGYGLSYTTFEFGKPSVKAKGNNIEVSVTIKNTGKVAARKLLRFMSPLLRALTRSQPRNSRPSARPSC